MIYWPSDRGSKNEEGIPVTQGRGLETGMRSRASTVAPSRAAADTTKPSIEPEYIRVDCGAGATGNWRRLGQGICAGSR